jgi:hypothetical protein
MIALAVAVVWLGVGAVQTPRDPWTEVNFIPVVGGDSDVGIGFGGAADFVRLHPSYHPYRWRLEVVGFITFKGQSGVVEIPFLDYYMMLAVPNLTASGRLRLELRPSVTSELTQKFYGLGNASPLPPPGLPVADSRYGRTHAHLAGAARWTLREHFFLRQQLDFSYSALTVRETSIFAQQRRDGPPEVRQLLDGPLQFGSVSLETTFEYDARDNEHVTRGGSYHHLRLRYVPPLPGVSYHFGQVNGTLRHYQTSGAWTWSARLVADALFGNIPFYELTRVDESSVLGGGKGIRGVPGQRYYGKVKLFGNLEAHVELWRFAIAAKPFVLSPALFADGGRVWLDYHRSSLDGSGLGLKYGLGGGLRLQQGTTFIVRADVAWSPDAHPIGAYFNAGQLF